MRVQVTVLLFALRSDMLRVVLVQDVPALGGAGEVVEVRPGFARNKLVPRRLAVYASEENLAAFSPLIDAAKAKAAAAAAPAVDEAALSTQSTAETVQLA